MKNRIIAFFMASTAFWNYSSQTGWTWTELSNMPEKISNNTVVEGFIGGQPFVYSFGGIDSTKLYSGINLSSFRYDVVADLWTVLPDLPDTLGKIASGVSRVGNKLYIIGGYHVLANGNEVSSDRVHIFNLLTNTFESDGANIPIPIDDHVQCVYKDSLIYVISGWSNSGNVANVQIYDPQANAWTIGTSTPNDNFFKAFGASGVIVGDTIFYNGGVKGGFNFTAVGYTRKGIIDTNDPTQIDWTQISDNPGSPGYRMACSNYMDKVFWLGGGGVAYNYNGIAYSGGVGVEPLDRILQYNGSSQLWDEGVGTPFQVMDLRGIAKISDTEWIICGGMESGQNVSNKTYQISYDPVIGSVNDSEWKSLNIFPNPAQEEIFSSSIKKGMFQITDLSGQLMQKGSFQNSIDVSWLRNGIYLLVIEDEGTLYRCKFEKK